MCICPNQRQHRRLFFDRFCFDEFSSSIDVNVNVNSYAILKITGAQLIVLSGVKRESGEGESASADWPHAPAASATVSKCGYIIDATGQA